MSSQAPGAGTDVLAGFEALASSTGIALPPLLRQLLATGKTMYGPDWAATWRERCLHTPPPLISCRDFEWMDADQARTTIEEWLHPDFQAGKRFLPFAESGAGDAWCLVPLDALDGAPSAGVALVRHDAASSEIGHASFADFACVQLLHALADISHWLGEDGLSEQEAWAMVRADVSQVAQGLDAETGAWLQAFCRVAPASRPGSALSLISAQQLAVGLGKFVRPAAPPLAIVARWNCEPPRRPAVQGPSTPRADSSNREPS
jgi:hypothetical protein